MTHENTSDTFSVSGTHCRSCELIIEKEISQLPGVNSVSASTTKKSVTITGAKIPTLDTLNKLFNHNGYKFSPRPVKGGDGGGFHPDIFFPPRRHWYSWLVLPSSPPGSFYQF